MGHYSHLMISGHRFLSCRDGHLPVLAAMFTEADRRPVVRHTHPGGQGWAEFSYATTVSSLRERLHVLGFTASRASEDLAQALLAWSQQQDDTPGWSGPVPNGNAIVDVARRRLSTDWDDLAWEDLRDLEPDPLEALSWHMAHRSYARLLLDCAPDPQAEACLDLSELTGCCVELDADQQIAGQSRADQLAGLGQGAPLLVLTEGSSDARLLTAGMEVTHPHLQGFVTFFDFDASRAEGGVAQLARTVKAFIGGGVANRFVALADNDTAGHDGLAKLKKQALPERCRVVHYPPLPLLEAYPTVGPDTDVPVPEDVNGRAGSLEMYLGRDVLQGGDGLMPVHWGAWYSHLGRHQGALTGSGKKAAQARFRRKVKAHLAGTTGGHEDWSGIRAVIDTVVTAFS